MTATPIKREKAGDKDGGTHVGSPVVVVGVDGSVPSWDAFAWAAGERCEAIAGLLPSS